jgi:cyclase
MLTKRIIPCLDVCNGRAVKGTNFENLRDAGDPVELAARYCDEGADELVLLDITASHERRNILLDVVERVAEAIQIPFTAGGGIRSVEDIRRVLDAGADKVSLNTAIVRNPDLLDEAAAYVGSQSIVAAIDVKRGNGGWTVWVRGGRENTGREAFAWVDEVTRRGAGELLLTSMDRDGTQEGYDLELLASIAERVSVPVIASGGAGMLAHFAEALTIGRADAVLAASLFHFQRIRIPELKTYLRHQNIPVRL